MQIVSVKRTLARLATRLVPRLVMAGLLLATFNFSLRAQEGGATYTLAGTARTSAKVPVPGATLRVTQTSTGQAWVSWTDENGNYKFPALPQGHYRVEFSQLGFVDATREIDLT